MGFGLLNFLFSPGLYFIPAFGDKWHMSAASDKNPGTPMPPAIAAVIVAAGSGSRMAGATPKQFLDLCGKPVLCHSVDNFASHAAVVEIVIVGPPDDLTSVRRALGHQRMQDERLRIVAGGATRQQSVKAGLAALGGSNGGNRAGDMTRNRASLVGIHDAARPLVSHAVIDRLAAAISDEVPAALPVLPVADTLKSTHVQDSVHIQESVRVGRISGTIDRNGVWAAQTPQMFDLATILALHEGYERHEGHDGSTQPVTDDVSLAEGAGLAIAAIEGDRRLMKLTHQDDLAMLVALAQNDPANNDPAKEDLAKEDLAKDDLAGGSGAMAEMMDLRVGNGFDVHKFADTSGPIMLAGISVPSPHGMLAHSDGDVGLHALCDAIFGALGDGDIGFHFPPSDARWKNADSAQFLRFAVERCAQHNAELRHLDLTIICETPKITPHRDAMRARIAEISGLPIARIGVKATTSEGLGFTGRGEGIAAQATASVLFRGGA